MKNRLAVLGPLLGLGLSLAVLALQGGGRSPEGTVTGAVVESRETPEKLQALLLMIQGSADASTDTLRISAGAAWVKHVSSIRLPENWSYQAEGGDLVVRGPARDCPAYFRLDAGKKPPEKIGIEVLYQGTRLFRDKKLPVVFKPPVQASSELSRAIRLPAYVMPGDLIDFKPLNPLSTPAGGDWILCGETARYNPGSGGYSVKLPDSLKPGDPFPVAYSDPFGFRLFDTPGISGLEVVPAPPAGSQPRLDGITAMVKVGDPVCVAGYFPDARSRSGLLLNGAPLPETYSSSSLGIKFGLGPGIKPGVQTLLADQAAGFKENQELSFTVIGVRGSMDRTKLMRGESTPLRLQVDGTEAPVQLELVNDTPAIISLAGGERQVVETSGGKDNVVSRDVKGLKKGEFGLSFSLTLNPCPDLGLDYTLSTAEPSEPAVFENLFDEVMDLLRMARREYYEAMDKAGLKDPAAHDLAREAEKMFRRLREMIDKGSRSRELGEETLNVLNRIVDDYVKQVNELLARPVVSIAVESPSVASTHQETPLSTAPREKTYARVTDGWLAPTQGVWQDDDIFEDSPGKQLTRTGPGAWKAELKMVVSRPTVVIGIRDKGRRWIRVEGVTNGTRLVPVRFRFKLIDAGGERIVEEEDTPNNFIPIDGPPGPEVPFAASIEAHEGLPRFAHFAINQAGPYRIEAHLIRSNGEETGIKVSVEGEAVATSGPRIRFIPVFFSAPPAPGWPEAFGAMAQGLAAVSAVDIPKYFPLAPGGLATSAEPARIIDTALPDVGLITTLLSKVYLAKSREEQDAENLRAVLSRNFGVESALNGTDKAVVLMFDKDFDRIRPGGTAEAFTMSQKLIVVHHDSSASTVAHELIHTLPYLWSKEQMIRDFRRTWHNADDQNFGNGLQIMDFRWRRDRVPAVMGSSFSLSWITQASYSHLLNEFRRRPDPPQILVTGYLARHNGRVAGHFAPAYRVEGTEELTQTRIPKEGWGIVLKDKEGRLLGTFPFNVSWWIPDYEKQQDLVAFVHRVPDVPGARTLELVGPSGLLDRKEASPNPPSVKVSAPGIDLKTALSRKMLRLSWKASDPDGDKLLSSVLYSGDDGKNWRVVKNETEASQADIPVYWKPKSIRIRIVVTDGWWSASDEAMIK